MSLIDDIQHAQVRAGEDVVVAHLERTLGGLRTVESVPRPATPAISYPQPFTDAQLKRLWNNSPQIAKDVTSCEAFKRVVRLAEAAHGMVVQP